MTLAAMFITVATICIVIIRHAPRLAVAFVATVYGLVLAKRARRVTAATLNLASRELDFDRKPTRAQRRLMKTNLRIALKQTELRSLFPATMSQVDKMIDG